MNDEYSQPPKNWLVESILVTVLCCLPFGVVGIIKASEVNSKFAAGDYEGAEESAKQAAKWTKIGFWIGISVLALYLIFLIVMVVFGASQGGSPF